MTAEMHDSQEIMVRVWGMDAEGHAFFQTARALHLTPSGALLSDMERALKPEEIIGLQYNNQKSRARVVQTGGAVLPGRMQATIEIVGGQPCPWLEIMAQPAPEASNVAPADNNSNKRRFPRLRAPFPFELRDERGGGSALKAHAADISGRGCYVETLVPLPLGTPLSITFWLDSRKIVTSAVVRSSDPGVGMGIEFIGLNEETKLQLQRHLEQMSAQAASQQ